jgi:hypothetical protein
MPFAGLGYADTLPLGFERLEQLPDGAALAGVNQENQQVLVADASLDDQRSMTDAKSDEAHELADELQRLEFKVNVVIQLLAQLLNRNSTLPPVRSVRLHADGLDWLAAGDEVWPGVGVVALHVSRHFPQPLRLPGRVVGTARDAEGDWVRFEFEGLTPSVIDLLERLVFRHHRRLIAGTRTTPRA